MEKFYRYLDVDGDGIPYRTLPGVHPKGAYFTRGSGHTKLGAYTEDSAEYQEVCDRLLVKWETARTMVPEAEIRVLQVQQGGDSDARQLRRCLQGGARPPEQETRPQLLPRQGVPVYGRRA